MGGSGDNSKEITLPTIYTRDALSAEGISGVDCKLRLLCDDDIVCYGKNIDKSFYSEQYFARFQRYKPLWKTEASFEHLTSGVFGDRLLGEISQSFQSLIGFGSTTAGLLIDDIKYSDQSQDVIENCCEKIVRLDDESLLHFIVPIRTISIRLGKKWTVHLAYLEMKIPKAQNSALLQRLSADGNKCWS